MGSGVSAWGRAWGCAWGNAWGPCRREQHGGGGGLHPARRAPQAGSRRVRDDAEAWLLIAMACTMLVEANGD